MAKLPFPAVRRFIAACAAVAALLLSGCTGGGSSAATANVSGQVTLDGQPLENGTLNLFPTGAGQARPASSPITAGNYKIAEAPVGKGLAFVVATKETGKMVAGSSEPVPEVVNIIPPQYKSGIEVNIAGDTNQLNIVMRSK